MQRSNIVVIQDSAFKFAELSGKSVAHVIAIGPQNCKDVDKLQKIWEYYDGKIPDEVFDTLKSFGEIFCFFDTPNDLVTTVEHWFPTMELIDSDEYDDVDMDYYISIESYDPQGNILYGC